MKSIYELGFPTPKAIVADSLTYKCIYFHFITIAAGIFSRGVSFTILPVPVPLCLCTTYLYTAFAYAVARYVLVHDQFFSLVAILLSSGMTQSI